MNFLDQDRLWLTEGQRSTKERTFLDPFAIYGFFNDSNIEKPSHRRVKSAAARTSSNETRKIKNRNHPPGYQTPDFHIGHNPTPTPATSRPASSRSGYSSVRTVKINQSSPTSLYLSTQRSRCKSAPVKPTVYIPRRPQTAKSKSRASSGTVRSAPQRAWELRTNSFTNYRSLLSPKEIQTRQKTRCKSAPLPYDFSSVELINEVPEDGTDYEKLWAMTKPFSCMPELVKNAVNHNGLRHCCSAFNTRTTVPPESRQQFWPVPRPGVYRRGFVPQYFSFVKPAHFSGDSPPPTITCTKPTEQQFPVLQDDFDETILFEENFDYPDTPSELSMSEQYDLSDNDADIIDDLNIREYLESRMGDPSDSDYDNDLQLSQLTPEPTNDKLHTAVVDESREPVEEDHNQVEETTPDIEVEIIINQTKPEVTAVVEVKPEQEIISEEKQDYTEPKSTVTEQETIEHAQEEEATLDEETYGLDSDETIVVENVQAKDIKDIPEEKPVEPQPPPPNPSKVTFIDSLTVTSYKTPEKKVDPVKPILKQPKPTPQPKPPMEEKPESVKKPKPRPMVERREADIKPQIKPGIVLKPEPPKEDKEEEEVEEKVETKPLEEKLPEPEFVHAPGAYRMYQAVDLHQHEVTKAKHRNKIHSKTSQMPLPSFTGGHHQMLPESTLVINSVMEDERRKKEGMKPWLQGRLALSKQTSRFELPMDVRVLESMTAMEYLTKYCIISTRRKALFKHIFQKVDKDRDGIIGFRELEKGLKEIHVDSIDVKQVRSIVEMVGADDKTKFNLKQFSAIAAFSERILFSNFVTEETKNINSTKEIIEEADFCSLKWKLDGFNVNPTVRRILEAL